jgi:diguanylate cyclase (GGDEF)-like protein
MFRSNRFLIISALVGLFVVGMLLFLYRSMTITSLVAQEERASASLAFVLSHVVLPTYQNFLEQSQGLTDDGLRGTAQIQALDRLVKAAIADTKIIKVQIINAQGRTLYSSDLSQIGNSKLESPGFQSAMRGVPSSAFSFRDKFTGAHGVYSNRNVVATYLPVKKRDEETLFGAFEIYSDVTDLVYTLNRNQGRIGMAVIGGMLLIYAILFVSARRADQLLRAQEEDRIAHEAKLNYQSLHDNLTLLPNRVSFLQRLEESIHRAKREGGMLGLMFIGIDRFKLVNDSLGHRAGDELLQITAKRLQSVFRECDLVFRIGGDEFAVIPAFITTPEGMAHLAQRVLDTMKAPIVIDNQSMIVTVSIGISLYPKDDTEAAMLVKNADAALCLSKQSGRNQYSFYTPEMNARALERLSYESALQQALPNDEFVLHYQPRVTSANGHIVGMEALLRWRRDDGRLVPPGEFIPILEDRDLIIDVGAWVLRSAVAQVQAWLSEGFDPVRVSVNVSSRQFRNKNFVGLVRDVIRESGIDPGYLELELTESLLLDNTQHAIEIMRGLKSLGVKLSIDDFGTGYSSLSYLKMLPIDYLKIDRSFISDVTTNEKDAAIVNTITTLAHELHIGVVAEGVETAEQWNLLRGKHCHELQGYYFSRPLEAAKLAELLSRNRVDRDAESPPDQMRRRSVN